MHRTRFRAAITLNPAAAPGEPRPPSRHCLDRARYLNPTRALMIEIRPLRNAGSVRHFPAEICWDSEEPLRPGDHAVVTITVTDDEAGDYFAAGQPFTLWSGGEAGHGVISRRVYTDHAPS